MDQNHIPTWVHNLALGDHIISLDGEISDVDHGDHVDEGVHTGPNAIGTIDYIDKRPGVGFSVVFDNGVGVFLSHQDLAEGNYRPCAGAKVYYEQQNIGKARYVINFHNGEKKHADGSPFFDVKICRNKKERDAFTKALEADGYKYRRG